MRIEGIDQSLHHALQVGRMGSSQVLLFKRIRDKVE
jgi:hypothetical protein